MGTGINKDGQIGMKLHILPRYNVPDSHPSRIPRSPKRTSFGDANPTTWRHAARPRPNKVEGRGRRRGPRPFPRPDQRRRRLQPGEQRVRPVRAPRRRGRRLLHVAGHPQSRGTVARGWGRSNRYPLRARSQVRRDEKYSDKIKGIRLIIGMSREGIIVLVMIMKLMSHAEIPRTFWPLFFAPFNFSLFLTSIGALYSCGWGADGQTGKGHYNASHIPSKVREI